MKRHSSPPRLTRAWPSKFRSIDDITLMTTFSLFATLFVMMHASGGNVRAAVTHWQGGQGDWTTQSNWSNGLPTGGENGTDAQIVDGAASLYGGGITGTGAVRDLLLGGAGTDINDRVNVFTTESGPGTLTSRQAYIGYSGFFGRIASVWGAGSTWTNSGDLIVGYKPPGFGELHIFGGGNVSSGRGIVGDFAGAQGRAYVRDNSIWSAGLELIVGNAGVGSLDIDDGGTVINTRGYVGVLPGSEGSVTVTGAGSTWDSGELIIGYQSTPQNSFSRAKLLISNGGAVSSSLGIIGDFQGAQGEATIDGGGSLGGSGSRWDSTELRVGNAGTGTLFVQNGGDVASSVSRIGMHPGSSGVAIVDGDGSTWNNSGDLIVGYQSEATNTLSVQSGGTVTSNRGILGDFAGAVGYAIAQDAGSSWDIGSELIVGNAGTGALYVHNFASVTSSSGSIGSQPNSDGLATVEGHASTWTNTSDLRVGNGGAGALNVTQGGDVLNTVGLVGVLAGSTGTATVHGFGSTWTNSSYLIVGYQSAGANTLNIQGGGVVTSNRGFIGDFAGAVGTVTLDGPGSRWNSGSELRIGNFGIGTLTVQNSADVVSTVGRIGMRTGSKGTASVSGAGSSWTMTGDLAIGGVGEGLLAVSNFGIVSATGGATIAPKGELTGDGTIVANVINHGDVRPSIATRSLTIDGNYAQSSFGTLYIDVDDADNYGSLSVNGNVALDGVLSVSILGGFPFFIPQIGDSFDILDWTGSLSGTFSPSSMQLPALPGSRKWNTSQLYTTGVISVISSAGLAGDFDQDGKVDAADYVVWRNGLGTTYTQADYGVWRANFGRTAGSGSALPTAESLSAAVPEPVTFQMFIIGVVVVLGFASKRSAAGR